MEPNELVDYLYKNALVFRDSDYMRRDNRSEKYYNCRGEMCQDNLKSKYGYGGYNYGNHRNTSNEYFRKYEESPSRKKPDSNIRESRAFAKEDGKSKSTNNRSNFMDNVFVDDQIRKRNLGRLSIPPDICIDSKDEVSESHRYANNKMMKGTEQGMRKNDRRLMRIDNVFRIIVSVFAGLGILAVMMPPVRNELVYALKDAISYVLN